MPKFIVLPCTGGVTDAPVFATALAVARRFGSHLAFLHVRPDVRQQFAALAAAEIGVVSGVGDTMERMERDADQHEHAVERLWRELCQRESITVRDGPPFEGVSTEWIPEVGGPADWVAEHGRTADLIVAGRAREGGGTGDGCAGGGADEHWPSGVDRAAPVVPASVGRIVTIAWKDTREAAGAVSAALPFIAQAGAHHHPDRRRGRRSGRPLARAVARRAALAQPERAYAPPGARTRLCGRGAVTGGDASRF